MLTTKIRLIVQKHPELKLKLKKANSKQTPFQYVYQSIVMGFFSTFAAAFFLYIFFKSNLMLLLLLMAIGLPFVFIIMYKFFFNVVDVYIRKYGRDLEGDLLFVSEFLLVSLESGLPLGNAIQRLSRLNRPGGIFFRRIYTDFKTGKDLQSALDQASNYAPTDTIRILLKRLKESLEIGSNLDQVLENFIEESSQKKIVEIQGFSKKLNPIVMMYLLIGIVLPSLGVTFFILGATLMELNSTGLGVVLGIIFTSMFLFQYFSYGAFKFGRSAL